MVGMASAINRPPLRGFRNCGRGISLGINVQQLDSAVESSHREISEPSLDALGCIVIHFAGKDERGLAALQNLAESGRGLTARQRFGVRPVLCRFSFYCTPLPQLPHLLTYLTTTLLVSRN